MKTCAKCGESKPLDSFYTLKSGAKHSYCRECASSASKKFRDDNIDKCREAEKLSYVKNRDKKLEAFKDYHIRNKERRAAAEKLRYEQNKEYIKQRTKLYRVANTDKIYAWNGARRGITRKAKPMWADVNAISAVYKEAIELSKQTGVKYHVDHIIPLKNENVCGLHVAENLRVLTASDNLAKSNKYECA